MRTRRHHNNDGRNQIKNGKTERDIRYLAKKLGIQYQGAKMEPEFTEHLLKSAQAYIEEYDLPNADATTSPYLVWPRIVGAYRDAVRHPERKYTARLISAFEYENGQSYR